MKISEFFIENFHFLVVKFSVYLNRRILVMTDSICSSPSLRKKSVFEKKHFSGELLRRSIRW